MITVRLGHRLALLILLWGVPHQLRAQAPDIDAVCSNPHQIDVGALGLAADDPLLKLFPENARDRLDSLVQNQQWIAAADSLEAWFAATGIFHSDRADDATVLLAQIESLAMLLVRADVVSTARADAVSTAQAADELNGLTSAVVDFNPQLSVGIRSGYLIFPAKDYEIAITEQDSPLVQRAFCWTAFSASDLLGLYRKPAFDALRLRIKHALSLWEAYNETGRSQYPWELWLNGLQGGPLKLEPPRTQGILLHPWVGVEAVGFDEAEWDDIGPIKREVVVPLDIIGFVRYDETYNRYWGASITMSIGEERTRSGIALHVTNGVSFGPTWAEFGLPDGLLFSVDFYKALAGLPYVQQEVETELRTAANTSLSQTE